MNKRVLIIDDDAEFTNLLRGVFEQADYTVHTSDSAEYALRILDSEQIGLVVTDQRMPGEMSGSDLIRQMREKDMRVPVIMVSGYLNDDAIRDMIRQGVQGVFIKPLNIFSLLKKASEIIEKQAKVAARANPDSGTDAASAPSGSIGQIEGLSQQGKTFVRRAVEAAAFKRNLLLIGPPGTLFEEIGRDIVNCAEEPERCVVFGPGEISSGELGHVYSGDNAEKPVTLILKDAEHLEQAEIDQLMELADRQSGLPGSVRMIFCLSDSVESLYDSGKIDEEFYLFLGTNELTVPALRDMPEDLLAIAKREILEQSSNATFDAKLRSLLLDHDWPENMLELRYVIVRAIQLALPMPPIAKHFKAALHPSENADGEADDMRSSLERFLHEEKRRYMAARNHLLQA